jgi:eukaryotic-like serine/threonine-protein kinase
MRKTSSRRVRFGAFELDLDTGELSGGGPTVQLAEKPLRILITLVEHGGQLVTRETLQQRLWPNDTIVDFEHGINTAMKVLRRALGDFADAPKYVETVPRRGYRLMVPVEWIEGANDPKSPGSVSPPSPPVRSSGMTGKIVSHYQVLDLIGGGGMGVVYRAEDLKLGRLVALKFLSEELGADPAALERFHREARAVSILDHPNICSIYEFGEHEGLPFLVMPLLQGQMLRDRLADSVARRQALPLEELLGVGLDISAGLQAAHEKGIIHRDIKPANVFLTNHGHAKILDFGVAKIVQAAITTSLSAEPALEPSIGKGSDLTRPRSCLGTYPYMSPEQAEGKEVDARTDLFSFGVVLCEMATGSLAFEGGDSAEIFKAIADGKPVPLKLAHPEIPPELERIIQKALEKDRGLRYQTAAEMHADLSRLKRDSGGQMSFPPVSASGSAARQKRWARAVIPSTVLLFAVLAAGGFFYFRARHSASPARSAWLQLTDFSDGATQPALSPDGRMLTFIRGPETFITPGQIYVKMLPDGQPVQLTHDNVPKMAPAFSPDGSRIAYTTVKEFRWNTWVVPVLGGEPRMLLPNAAALTWVANGEVVFSEIKTGVHMGISTAKESRSEEREVYVPADLAGMAHRSWVSPDRKWVIVSQMGGSGWDPCRLVSFDERSQGRIIGPKNARCTYAAWSQDGKTMYFTADASDGYHVWRQTFPDGPPEQLTFGATSEEGIAFSPDGHSLITSAGIRGDALWVHDAKGDRQISEEGFAVIPGIGYGGVCGHSAFSPDGKRLLYMLNAKNVPGSTFLRLWSTDLDSGRSEPMLPNVSMGNFDLSPEGNQVAYNAQDSKGEWRVWLAPLDLRTSPAQFTSRQAYWPCFGAGGDVYFRIREGSGQDLLYVQEPKDPKPRQVSLQSLPYVGAISPKGDIVLYGFNPLVALSITDGASRPLCQFCNAGWGLGGNFFYIRFRDAGEMGGGTAVAFSLPTGEELPPLPASGLNSLKDVDRRKVARIIDLRDVLQFNPGPSPDIYAYTRTTIQRNLFRIPLN